MQESFRLEDLRKSHPDVLAVIAKAEQEIASICGKQIALICYLKGDAVLSETQPIH